jgi:hypothetical protein
MLLSSIMVVGWSATILVLLSAVMVGRSEAEDGKHSAVALEAEAEAAG